MQRPRAIMNVSRARPRDFDLVPRQPHWHDKHMAAHAYEYDWGTGKVASTVRSTAPAAVVPLVTVAHCDH